MKAVSTLVLSCGLLLGAQAADTWAFNPPKDTFDKKAQFDLRDLNEKIAGENGFIKLSKDGESFVNGKSKPIRFWSLNSGAYNQHPKKPKIDLERHYQFIAKRGVNMVRFHGNITPRGGDINNIDNAEREKLWRAVAGAKKAGIYMTYSPYWANSSKIKPGTGGIVQAGGNHGLLFFDKKLQEAYKNWFRKVLTEKNPHTGIALKDDPALAMIQIQNEDSLLFWTAQGIKGGAKTKLEELFGDFAKKKYGSIDKAIAAWDGTKVNGDAPGQGRLGLEIVWQMTKDGNIHKNGSAGQKKRLADQLEYSARLMYDFNKEIGRFLKEDLGCKQIVNAGNWKTADNATLNDAERWSYTANEVIGVNRYYGGIHKGKHQGWAIINGDEFSDESAMLNPRKFPLTLRLVSGHPMCIFESSWVPPQGYQSEAPLLIAAYSSLTGFDSYYWFASGEEDWRHPSSANGYLPSIGKWVCATPMLLGQWPAASLAFRKGYIKEGEAVVSEHRGLDDIWQRKQTVMVEDSGFDPNRDKGDFVPLSNIKTVADPLSYLVGPVKVKYDSDLSKSTVAKDLSKHIDNSKQVVTSNTGELIWDHKNGIVTVDAPKAQGVTGFIKGKEIKLSDCEFKSSNPYITIMAVSLDDKELSKSSKILVQVGTKERPTGWQTQRANLKGAREPQRITNFGKGPWQIDKADLVCSIANKKLKELIVCDSNFMEKERIKIAKKGKKVSFSYPEDTMYVVLTDGK